MKDNELQLDFTKAPRRGSPPRSVYCKETGHSWASVSDAVKQLKIPLTPNGFRYHVKHEIGCFGYTFTFIKPE